jgi:hypothetical protein
MDTNPHEWDGVAAAFLGARLERMHRFFSETFAGF